MGQTAFVDDVSYQRDFDFFFPSQARSSLTAHITDIIAIGMAAINQRNIRGQPWPNRWRNASWGWNHGCSWPPVEEYSPQSGSSLPEAQRPCSDWRVCCCCSSSHQVEFCPGASANNPPMGPIIRKKAIGVTKTRCTPCTLCTLNIYAKGRILTRQVPLFPQQEAIYKHQEPIFEK